MNEFKIINFYVCIKFVTSRLEHVIYVHMHASMERKSMVIIFFCFISDNEERRVIERERLQHELSEYDDKLNRQVEG